MLKDMTVHVRQYLSNEFVHQCGNVYVIGNLCMLQWLGKLQNVFDIMCALMECVYCNRVHVCLHWSK